MCETFIHLYKSPDISNSIGNISKAGQTTDRLLNSSACTSTYVMTVYVRGPINKIELFHNYMCSFMWWANSRWLSKGDTMLLACFACTPVWSSILRTPWCKFLWNSVSWSGLGCGGMLTTPRSLDRRFLMRPKSITCLKMLFAIFETKLPTAELFWHLWSNIF